MNQSEFVREVEIVLWKHDPEGLIRGCGAPPDEYRNEAIEIGMALQPGQTLPAVQDTVEIVFHRNFDYVYRLPNFPRTLWCKHALLLCEGGARSISEPGVVIEEKKSSMGRSASIEKIAIDLYCLLNGRAKPP